MPEAGDKSGERWRSNVEVSTGYSYTCNGIIIVAIIIHVLIIPFNWIQK